MNKIVLDPTKDEPFYLRLQSGECGGVDTLEDALKVFLGPKGYRLTIVTSSERMVIRRDSEPTVGLMGEKTFDATVTTLSTAQSRRLRLL